MQHHPGSLPEETDCKREERGRVPASPNDSRQHCDPHRILHLRLDRTDTRTLDCPHPFHKSCRLWLRGHLSSCAKLSRGCVRHLCRIGHGRSNHLEKCGCRVLTACRSTLVLKARLWLGSQRIRIRCDCIYTCAAVTQQIWWAAQARIQVPAV